MISKDRYNCVAVVLHWLIGIGVIGMLLSGLVLAYAPLERDLKIELFGVHKATGLLILFAVGLRILWRGFSEATKQVPALPLTIPKREAIAAKIGHILLYITMFAMPFSGWMLVSTSARSNFTEIFGLFNWPDIPGVQGNEFLHEMAENAHTVIAIILAILIVGHVAAVVKHIIVEKENLLPRMWFGK